MPGLLTVTLLFGQPTTRYMPALFMLFSSYQEGEALETLIYS